MGLMLFFACIMQLVAVSGLCVQVFHSLFWPLEFTLPGRDNNKCYAKIICNKLDNVRLLPLLAHNNQQLVPLVVSKE